MVPDTPGDANLDRLSVELTRETAREPRVEQARDAAPKFSVATKTIQICTYVKSLQLLLAKTLLTRSV